MRRYGTWAGSETAENKACCVVLVSQGWYTYQCSRKRGHGPDGLYCKQHAKMVEAGKHVYVPNDEGVVR